MTKWKPLNNTGRIIAGRVEKPVHFIHRAGTKGGRAIIYRPWLAAHKLDDFTLVTFLVDEEKQCLALYFSNNDFINGRSLKKKTDVSSSVNAASAVYTALRFGYESDTRYSLTQDPEDPTIWVIQKPQKEKI